MLPLSEDGTGLSCKKRDVVTGWNPRSMYVSVCAVIRLEHGDTAFELPDIFYLLT